MKFAHLKFLFLLTFLSFLISCGDDDNGGESLAEYFIQFEMNGELHAFQVEEPGYSSCGSCACAYIPPLATSSAGIDVCIDNEFDEFPASEIENLEGSTIVFNDDIFPNANFSFSKDGVDYSTYSAPNQTGSTFAITDVSEDGEFGIPGSTTFQAFKVKGTFTCTVRADDDDTDIAITEGKFVVRFTEN